MRERNKACDFLLSSSVGGDEAIVYDEYSAEGSGDSIAIPYVFALFSPAAVRWTGDSLYLSPTLLCVCATHTGGRGDPSQGGGGGGSRA